MEAYRALRERDAVGRRHGFIAEGATVLGKAIRRYPLRSVLLSPKQHARMADLLEALKPDIPVYVAEQPVLDAICGFDLHRGVLALGARPILPDPDELLGELAERSTVVCLIGINDVKNRARSFATPQHSAVTGFCWMTAAATPSIGAPSGCRWALA